MNQLGRTDGMQKIGITWYGTVWHSMVWYGEFVLVFETLHDAVQSCVVLYAKDRHCTVCHGMVWYGVVLYAKDRHGGGEGGGAPS